MDVETAFLQGEIDGEIYMAQPKGFADDTRRVCKLNKAIYGLKQAGRQCNLKLIAKLLEFGLERIKCDPCIYVHRKMYIIIAIYVDDFLIFHRDANDLKKVREYLNKNFPMKDLGEVKRYLGLNFTRGEDFIELDQEKEVYGIHSGEIRYAKL